MDRETFPVFAAGAFVYGAIYVLGIIAAAIAWHAPYALFAALLTAGVSYLCFMSQIMFPRARIIAHVLVMYSIILGLTAAFLLMRSF